jgi:single-strand DNA-binding protein
MASRSLNKVLLIGNLTRDPELRYTPTGAAVCTFGLATNRSWQTESGEKHEQAEFHTIVAWNKLGEICAEFLTKGKQCYVEGRLSTREWEGQDGQKRRSTEVIANEVIFLGSAGGARGDSLDIPEDFGASQDAGFPSVDQEPAGTTSAKPSKAKKSEPEESDDIPF